MPGTSDFTGQTAVVTGGSGVLCGPICRALALSGANTVIVAGTRRSKAEDLAAKITKEGGVAVADQADVTQRESLEALAERVIARFGGVDILINGAGGAKKEATTSKELNFFDLPDNAVESVFDLNFHGTFRSSQVFGRHMITRPRGSIVMISSMGAIRPLTRSVAYSAGKAAVSNFTQWLAVHFSQEYDSGVRINAIVPGFFLTEQNRFLLQEQDGQTLTERGRRIIEHTPMGRFGRPEELVGPTLWLLSEEASFVHGSCLLVDGGLNAYGGV